jgi:hypothetical protein
VYARLKDGPAAWKWAEVAADSRLHIDLALDPENFGAVEVKVPPDSRMPVRLVPAELAGPMADRQFLNQLSYSLGFEGKPQDGTASIPHVPPGKYLIICEPDSPLHQRELEVTAGQTTVVESTPKKQDE